MEPVVGITDGPDNGPDNELEIFAVPVFPGNDLFPVPLVYIDGVDVVQILIPANGVHIGIQAVADAEIIEYVGREKFLPPPNVDSAVVKIDINRNKYEIKDVLAFRKLVRVSFLMKRKTLINNLIKGYDITKSECESILNSLNIDVNARAENLSAIDFINLCNLL